MVNEIYECQRCAKYRKELADLKQKIKNIKIILSNNTPPRGAGLKLALGALWDAVKEGEDGLL